MLAAVELLNFGRLGMNTLVLVPCSAHYALHFLIFDFFFLFPNTYSLLSLQKRVLAMTEGYVKATLKTFLWK